MPLPRFARLESADRERLLRAAILRLATDGERRLSLAGLAADAGISRAAAYHYFDSPVDAANAAREAARRMVMAELGVWNVVSTDVALWQQLADASGRLRELVRATPGLGVVLMDTPDTATEWFASLVENAERLGLLQPAAREAAMIVTPGIVRALDVLEVQHPGRVPSTMLAALLQLAWQELSTH